jgi:dTDP-4-dehydrorhamnose 3,5-epimerase
VAALKVYSTPIAGLLVVELEVHADNRGWFKENWQRAKMVELGVPDFGPVQNNMSFNTTAGATRGIHAEPWDRPPLRTPQTSIWPRGPRTAP